MSNTADFSEDKKKHRTKKKQKKGTEAGVASTEKQTVQQQESVINYDDFETSEMKLGTSKCEDHDTLDVTERKMKKKEKKHGDSNFAETFTEVSQDPASVNGQTEKIGKHKKKKKKLRGLTRLSPDEAVHESQNPVSVEEGRSVDKQRGINEQSCQTIEIGHIEKSKSQKKKKKKVIKDNSSDMDGEVRQKSVTSTSEKNSLAVEENESSEENDLSLSGAKNVSTPNSESEGNVVHAKHKKKAKKKKRHESRVQKHPSSEDLDIVDKEQGSYDQMEGSSSKESGESKDDSYHEDEDGEGTHDKQKKKKKKRHREEDMNKMESVDIHDTGVDGGDEKPPKKKKKKSKEKGGTENEWVENESTQSQEASGKNAQATDSQWQSAEFGDAAQKDKFLRLMGAYKSSNKQRASSSYSVMAMNRQQERALTSSLEKQFDQAMQTRKVRGVGLGYHE